MRALLLALATLAASPVLAQTLPLTIPECNCEGGAGGSGDVVGPASASDNAACRYDTTTGKLVQNSGLIIADVSGSSLGVSTAAGNALAISATAPAATTGASQAGKAASLTASDAVASTDTAGAATGGTATIVAGNAARLTSGDAAGGDVTLATGTGIGTGRNGQVVLGAGSVGIDTTGGTFRITGGSASPSNQSPVGSSSIRIYNAGDTSQATSFFFLGADSYLGIYRSATPAVKFTRTANAENAHNAGLSNSVDGRLDFDGGTTADRLGWIGWAGEDYAESDATNATDTAASTGLSITVRSGRKYSFTAVLFLSDSVAAEGAKIDFGGGTATETYFRGKCEASDTTSLGISHVDDITDTVSVATITGDGSIVCDGSFEAGGAGTFIPRFSQVAHVTGTLTLYRGSHIVMHEQP